MKHAKQWTRVVVPVLLLFLAASTAATASAAAPDLVDVYEMALENDPRIHQARARLDQVREAKPQARSRLLPSVSLAGRLEETWQDGEQIGLDPVTGDVGQVDFESNTETSSYGLEIRQTLFRWDAWAGLSEANARIAQAEAEYDGALQDLPIRVSQAYFDLLLAEENLETRVTTRESFEVELNRAEFSREVGVASRTDVEEARAAHDRAVADEIATQRQLEVARERLYELTGRPLQEVTPLSGDIQPSLPEPADIDFWVDRAITHNPELNATRHLADASADRVSQARSGHYPTVDLVASRNYVDRAGDNPFQNQDTMNDSVSVQLTVPLFTGGATRSRVREARAAEREAWSGVELATREVRGSARDAFLGIRSGVSQIQALAQAVKSSETAVEATEVGVEVGSRSTVDLLNARRELANARARLSEVRYAYLIDNLRLRRAIGQLDADYLERLSRLFVADQDAGD